MMSDLLTTKQVIDLLKVDRVTIYRMLQDGRLRGVKIGQQWRFSRAVVERLISGEMEPPPAPAAGTPLPTHCLQTVQNLFSDVSGLGALLVDPQGQPITRPSAACAFCRLLQSRPSGLEACQNSWRTFAQAAQDGQTCFTCHAGLEYCGALVEDNGAPIGLFLIGPFHRRAPKSDTTPSLAAAHGLDPLELQAAADSISSLFARHTPPEEVQRWAKAAVSSIHSILSERSSFMQRLQQISDLTQIS